MNAGKDLEREKTLIRSHYEKELDELRKRLRDGDEDMESVRVHEQNQRLQLLDEVSLEKGVMHMQTGRLIFRTCSSTRHKKRLRSSTCSYELEADDHLQCRSWYTEWRAMLYTRAWCPESPRYFLSTRVSGVDLGFKRCPRLRSMWLSI